MTTALYSRPAWLAFWMMATLWAGQAAIAAQPTAAANPTVCSGAPTEIGSVLAPEVATAEDIQAFHQAVDSLRTELDQVCRQDKTALKRFKAKAQKVVFEMSAGATEPTAYFNDSQLIVEFYGGSFDARQFRQIVKKVLQGKPIPRGD